MPDTRPSPIPPGTLSAAGVILSVVEVAMQRIQGWQIVAALAIVAVVAISRSIVEAWKAKQPPALPPAYTTTAPEVVK